MTKAWRSSEFFGGENSSPNSPESKRRNGGRTEGSLRLSISQNGSPLSGSLTTDQLRLLKSKLLECLDKLLNCLEPAPTRKIVLESLIINNNKPRLDLSQFIEISDLIKVFRVCLSDGSRDVRITTLRVIKYFAWSLEHIKALMDHHLDIFLIRYGLVLFPDGSRINQSSMQDPHTRHSNRHWKRWTGPVSTGYSDVCGCTKGLQIPLAGNCPDVGCHCWSKGRPHLSHCFGNLVRDCPSKSRISCHLRWNPNYLWILIGNKSRHGRIAAHDRSLSAGHGTDSMLPSAECRTRGNLNTEW